MKCSASSGLAEDITRSFNSHIKLRRPADISYSIKEPQAYLVKIKLAPEVDQGSRWSLIDTGAVTPAEFLSEKLPHLWFCSALSELIAVVATGGLERPVYHA